MQVANYDWMHCNNCFRSKTVDLSFYVSACSHIFCKFCTEPTCCVCGKTKMLTMLDSSMPARMQIVFNDLETHIRETPKIIEYQWRQRSLFEAAKREDLRNLLARCSIKRRMRHGLTLLEEDLKREAYKKAKVKDCAAKMYRYHKENLLRQRMMQAQHYARNDMREKAIHNQARIEEGRYAYQVSSGSTNRSSIMNETGDTGYSSCKKTPIGRISNFF